MIAVRVIQPSSPWSWIDWRELWDYRELLYFFILRDITVRYKQTLIGAGWTVLQPAASLLVYAYLFGHIGGFSAGDIPYSLFVLTGLLPWSLFANAVTGGSQSIITNASLITKVYFPRLIVPLATLGTSLFDFLVSLGLLVLALTYFRASVAWTVVFTPLVILAIVVVALGVQAGCAALVVLFRDVRHVVPFLIQLGFFLTPVLYQPKILPASAQWLLFLNPMAGLIELFRGAILDRPVDPLATMLSLSCGLLAFVVGCLVFRAAERRFADIV